MKAQVSQLETENAKLKVSIHSIKGISERAESRSSKRQGRY